MGRHLKVVPARTEAQRHDALTRANVVRVYRAQLKRDLKAGRVSVRRVIARPGELVESMKVGDLLIACPRFGRVKVGQVLREAAVSPSKTLAGLSPRQRAALLTALDRREREYQRRAA